MRQLASQAIENSQGFMSEKRYPIPSVFLENELFLKKGFVAERKWNNESRQWVATGKGYITMSHGHIGLWDGQPEYCSWYD